MPLMLALKLGEDFFVGEERFEVAEIATRTRYTLVQPSTGRRFEIIENIGTQILPGVVVSATDRRARVATWAVLAVTAPRAMRILRGALRHDRVAARQRSSEPA